MGLIEQIKMRSIKKVAYLAYLPYAFHPHRHIPQQKSIIITIIIILTFKVFYFQNAEIITNYSVFRTKPGGRPQLKSYFKHTANEHVHLYSLKQVLSWWAAIKAG